MIEHHFGKNVWVHRKGAIRLRKGDIGIIPGAMGSYSYIVEGLGSPLTFESCSHGAGRRMGRKKASEEITVQQTMEDLNNQGIVLGKSKKDDVAEESRFAYKDIGEVINNQKDVLVVKKKLKTVGVIKA
jgi:tRNA-splicing ligase RtcB